jgi:hypothetical protein
MKSRAAWATWIFGPLALSAFIGVVSPGQGQAPAAKGFRVQISADKTERGGDGYLPLDPQIRVEYQYTGSMNFGVTGEGKNLTCGPGAAFTMFKIDDQVTFPNAAVQSPLPPAANNKPRHGTQASWSQGEIKVTMTLEVVPGRPAIKDPTGPQKRRMDALLIKYTVENTGNRPHQFAARMLIDTMCGNNDGAIFAAPTTRPGELLDGVEFRGKEIPDFVEILERPDLKNPGFKGAFTFKLGNKLETPGRVVLTGLAGTGPWDVQVIKAMGDSAVAFFWEPKALEPKAKRELAFAYGQGVACNPEDEGKVSVALAGNFEPNKLFTVTAYVNDPIEGQNLTLELPKGVQRVDGRETQAVPLASPDQENSVVLWRCRVLEPGTFPIRIRSSNGTTLTRELSVSKAE